MTSDHREASATNAPPPQPALPTFFTPQPEGVVPQSVPAPSAPPPAPAPSTPPPLAVAPPPTDGVNRCPRCGGSQVTIAGDILQCTHCRYQWRTQRFSNDAPATPASMSVTPGAAALTDMRSMVTVTCSGCGAKVTINVNDNLRATCHWCRSVLSVNNPASSGAVPDAILPFVVTRERALASVKDYVSRYATYAPQDFLNDVQRAELSAVYLPYFIADAEANVRLDGAAWYDRGLTDSESKVYGTMQYQVMREATFTVDDLAIEARTDRSVLAAAVSTSNIINAIQPFDLEHAVAFDARYIANGITFERRDMEAIDTLPRLADQMATVARGYVNQTLMDYTGGVRWESERVTLRSAHWASALLPIWIYSYSETTSTGSMLHYIAVNGRTGEVQGSIPINERKVAASARRWGVVGGLILAAFPLSFVALGLGTLLVGGMLGLVFVGIGGAVAAVFGSFGFKLASWRRRTLREALRHADERLAPEREVRYIPTAFRRADRRVAEFQHRGGPEIDGRNDHRPQDRAAARPSVAVVPDGQLLPREYLWATAALPIPSGGQHARVGRPPSALPPGQDPRAGGKPRTGWTWGWQMKPPPEV